MTKLYPFLLCFVLLLSVKTVAIAQNISLQGVVKDTLGQTLFGVNLIAMPLEAEAKMTFAITDDRGAYKLNIQKNASYALSVSSLGFSTLRDTIQYDENTTRNIVLKTSTEELEAVIVKAELAVLVQGDTITYRTDQFKTGTERKLRELLKNLPGVEVDRLGNVTVNGKEVTDLLVDGKAFFGGDTKLGVNNIPAEVVAEVEVVDDYHEVGFMKGLEESDRMSMNIKLKEGKNKFVFGETQVGAGIKDRHYIQPTIFYYSPKTTLNFIGSYNNTNHSPLSFSDLMRFQGGLDQYEDNPIASNSYLSQFMNQQDLVHKKLAFSAFNFTHELSKKLRMEAYSILTQEKSEALRHSEIEYITDEVFLEERKTSSKDKNFSLLNNLKFRYQPKNTKDVAYEAQVNASSQDYFTNIHTQTQDLEHDVLSKIEPENIELRQFFRLNSQPKFKHTSRLTAEQHYARQKNLRDWVFEQPPFSDLIPFEDEDVFNFLQNAKQEVHSAKVQYKHYWVLAPLHHIYPVTGVKMHYDRYSTQDYQLLEDGEKNEFTSADFNNDLRFNFMDPYLGFQYKTQIARRLTLRPGIVYHHYLWNVKQFGEEIAKKDKAIWLPELLMEFKYRFQSLKFNYNLESSLNGASSYANRYRLIGFNQLYKGNEDIENSLHHHLKLDYSNVNRASQTMLNASVSYTRKEKTIKSITAIEGVEQVSSLIYSNLPETNFNTFFRVSKNWSKSSLGVSAQKGWSDFNQWINNTFLDYKSSYFSYQLSASSWKEKLPFVRASFRQVFYNTKSENYSNSYWTATPRIDVSYRMGAFVLKADYDYTYNKQKNQSESYEFFNASIYYNKEDSPWGFELRVDNLMDIKYKRSHSFSQFMIYDQWTFVQPRTAMFILSYKL